MAAKTDKEKKYPDWWYQSKNQEEMNAVAGQIASRPAFRFEVNHEALYDYYKGEHERQGREAQIDTQAKGAALTGGYGNSYAAQAGQRAYDTQMEKLNRDVVPELREMAADQYDRETKALTDRFSALQKQEKADYEAWEEENEDKIEAWEQSQREVATGGIYTTLRENIMDVTTPAQLNRFDRVMASAPGRALPATKNQTQQSQASKEAADKLFTAALGSNGGAAVYYARAVDQMKAAGVSSGVMSGLLKEKDWKALQDQAIKNYNSKTGALNLAAVAYDNYTEYLRAYVSMATNIKNANNVRGIDLPEGYESTGNAAFDIFTAEYLRRVQNEDPAAKKFKETAAADHMKDQADRAEAYVREVSHWNDRANEINLMGTAGHRIPEHEQNMLEWIGNTYGNTDDALAAARASAFRYRREADNLVATNRAIYADDFSEKSVFDSAVTDETYRKTNTRGEDNFLEDQEIAVYNYIYATEGAAKAQAYLDTLTDKLNKRKGQSKADSVDGNFLGQMWVKAQAGFDQFGSGLDSLLFNFHDAQPKDPSVIQYASAAVDEDLAEVDLKWYNFADKQWKDQDIFGRSLGQMAGDTVQTTANMLPSIGIASAASLINPTVGSWVGAILMGSSAAGNAYQDMLNQGYAKSDAAAYGAMVGISEATLEKVLGGISPISGGGGLQKFASKFAKVDSVLKRFADSAGGKILLNAGSEAMEEGLQSVLEPFFKTIVTGEEFTVDMEEALYSALLGFVTGGMFESGTQAIKGAVGKISDSIRGKKDMAAEAAGNMTQQAAPAASAGVQSVAGKDTSAVKTPSATASAPAQADVAATVRNDRTAQTGSAKTENVTLKAASKKYGAQAATMESAYQEGQDVERFDREYKLAFDMGKEGASRELLDNGGAFAYLTAQQKNTAYQSGAAAAENAGIVAEAVKSLGITGEHAGVLTQSFNANQTTAKDYAMGLQEAYEAGKTGIPMKEAGSHAAKLTDAQRQIAYKQGQKAHGRQVAKQQAQVRKNRSAEGADTSKGKVHFDGDRSSLNKTQRASMDAMEVLAKTLGVQIYVENFEGTKNANKNGWYDPKDGSIHININAGADGKGTMLFTVAHELTHFIRQWSPAKFRVLANFVTKRYADKGISVRDLMDDQIAKAKEDDRELTDEEALEEVVADSMETMLIDGSIMEMMAEIRQQDHGLWAKIKEWFRDLAGKLQAVVDAYKGVQPDSTEGRMVADMKDMIGTLQALYMDALVDASENFDAGVQKITTEDSGGVKYQARPSIKSPDVLDPKTVTRADVAEMLEGVKAGKYAENSYIPVRISTPGIVQERLFASDIPIIMPVSKVAQALKEDGGAVKGKNIRGHGLSPEQLIDIIERMDSPDHVYAQNNGRGVEVIRLGVDSNNIVVIVEFDNNVNPAYMNGYEGGVYNVSVTAFNVDGGDVGLFMYSQEKGWREVFNKQKEGDPAKKFPATRPFAIEQDSLNDNVSQSGNGVNKKFSMRDTALEHFGRTFSWKETGYLLTDGEKLDFSGRHEGASGGYRTVDHRDILDIYPEDTELDGNGAMVDFMSQGNIRIMPEGNGINLSVKPTKAQEQALDDFISRARGEVTLDIDDERGNTVVSVEYPRLTRASKVIQDIYNYFETGAEPVVSSLAQFRWSQRDVGRQEAVTQALEKENAKLREDVAELRELVKLQRQVTNGTKFTKTSVEAAAISLKQGANAKGSTQELAKLLNGLYEYIASAKELTWEGVKEQAQGAVDWLWEHIDRQGKPTEYAQEILRQIHGARVRLDESQMAEAEYRFGSYEQFRKGLMGSITFAKNAEMSLDSLWAELSEMYPDVFDSEITAADMPGALVDIIHRLRSPDTAVDYARNRELMEQELLREIYDSYWRVSTLYTPADVGARRINKLKMEHYQRMDKLKQQHRETIDRLKQAHQARLEQVRREHRARLEEKVEQVTKRYQDARKQNVEGRKKTEQRRKIRKTIRELSKLLAHGTKERNVKEGMKDFVSTAIASAEVLFTDEYTNEDMIRNGVECECEGWESSLIDKTRALIRQRDELLAGSTAAREVEDVMVGDLTGYEERMNLVRRLDRQISENMGKLKGVFARERSRLNKATVSSLLSSLAEEYWKLGTSEEAYIRGALDENVHQHLMNLSQEIGGTTVKDMSLSQLEDLHRAYTMVLTTVRNANKSFAENLKGSRQEQAQAVIWDLAEAGKKRKKQTKGQIARAKRSWNNLKSVYAFERIGSGTLKQLYENLRGGEDTWMVDMDQAREFFLKAARDSGYNGWDLNKQIYSFESSTGLKFDLNLGQIMSIYAYARRGQQAIDHLMKGGFVFDQYTEERVTEHGIPKTYLKDDATAYNLSLQTIQEIIGKLTPEQSAFVEAMQDYLSDTMGGKGNEVSMKLYGVKLFGEKHYFPLRSSGVYLSKAADQEQQKQQGQVSIKNAGFTHSTTPNAANPVVLSGFMDVWAGHVNDMSMYHAFVLPLEDFNRVYHFSSPHTESGQSGSVNQAIINACGSAATGYIDQFIRDLNGGVVADPREGDFKKWISKFKKASVMASASVVVQQPSAIVRALAYIDPKYFGVATLSRGIGRALGNKITHNHTKLYDELKRYAPVAAIKQMGRFDTDMGLGAVDYLTAKEFQGFKEKLKAVFTEKGYLGKRADEIAGFAAARADEITWAQIWQAVKNEVADKQGLTVGSEEHLKAAGQRFTEVVTRTQVYDSVFSRSANMRSKGAFMSMATSFMAEPTTTANMLTDAIRKAKKGDVKFFLRVGASVAGSIIFNNILRSAVYAVRDDDEDETLVEKYLQALSGGLLDDMNPMSYLPFWRDVWSLAQGYDVERADMSVIATLMDAGLSLAEAMAKDTDGMTEEELEAHNERLKDLGWKFVDGLASAVGLPEKNLRRDILGAVNFFETVKADGGRQTTAGSLKDKVWEDFVSSVPGVNIVVDADSRSDDLYDAIVAGDDAYVNRLKAGYKTEQSYLQAKRKGLKENDVRIKTAAKAWMEGDMESYMTIAMEIIAEGRFTQDDVVVAINGVINELTPGGSSASAPKAKGLFDANAFATAISQDDAEMAKFIQADIIRTAQRNGKTEEEAKKSFVSSVTSACKEMFGEGELSEEQAVEALTEFCGKDKTEARASVAYWDFAMEHPDVEASAGWFESYYRKVENSGIAIEDYVEYRNRKTGYTKREDILAVIDGMDLTKAQKDALYRAEGYAESTLDEAPWHK